MPCIKDTRDKIQGGIFMQEIKCPKCGELFQVDESGYAAIVKQAGGYAALCSEGFAEERIRYPGKSGRNHER